MISRGLKALFLTSLFGAILITLAGGWYTWEEAPPYPSQVVGPDGKVICDREDIMQGQQVWQKYGLMDNGSVWGHGTYRGNDYTATTLHLTGLEMRDYYARQSGAAALYLAPIAGKKEPKKQRLLVNILFAAIVLMAVGSLTGTALGVKGLAGKAWFWIGHQGWEFLELGRLWQILLFVGLIAGGR